MRIIADPNACNGCRICELACSFHHQRVFGPDLSSIKVSPDWLKGEVRLAIDSTCDLCRDETQPLCVESCAEGALKKEAESEPS